MKSKARVLRSGTPFSALLFQGAALLAGATALAAGAASPATGGLLQMPNVRVETATPQQLEQAARMGTTAQAGMRAYKDPVSGQLRDQTPEEMMEGGHAKAATFAAPKSYSLPSGATVMPLDESFMMNAVVGKDAAGKVRFQCVGSGDTAAALSRVPSAKEHRHDH